MVSLELLQLYKAIADAGSIAGGARRMRVSPSMASRKLAALELEMSARLLVRSTRHLQFTPAGVMFLDWANVTLSSFDSLSEALGVEKQEFVGLLRVASNDYSGHRFLTDALVHFRRTYPRLRFQATIADDPLTLLDQGYDLVIHSGPAPNASLIGRKIGSYRRILCASPQYLERHGTPKKLEDLSLHCGLGHSRSRSAQWYFRTASHASPVSQTIPIVLETNSYPMLMEMVLKGGGVLQIAEILVEDHLASGNLQLVLPDFSCVEPDGTEPAMWLVYPDRKLTSRSRIVVDFLLAAIKGGFRHGLR